VTGQVIETVGGGGDERRRGCPVVGIAHRGRQAGRPVLLGRSKRKWLNLKGLASLAGAGGWGWRFARVR